jgi:DNA-directed RNA polymerase subunit RPC12/RpoP
MIFTCPKCSAKTELDISLIPEGGTSARCSACNSDYLVSRESIANRANRKGGEINCARCGKELDASLVCSSCGEMYPDYFVPETPEAVRSRRIRMMIDTVSHLRDVSFEWGTRSTPTIDYRLKRRPQATREKPREAHKEVPYEKVRIRYIKLAAGLLIAALLFWGGSFYYRQHKAKQQYAFDYVRAVYLIKTGSDRSIKACAKMAEEWKTKSQAGQSGVPHITAAEETALLKVKAEVDVYMRKTFAAPKAFVPAKESLVKLQGSYLNLHALALAPPGTLAAFTDTVTRSEAEFRKSAKSLKASLPDAISEELRKGALRRKELQDL